MCSRNISDISVVGISHNKKFILRSAFIGSYMVCVSYVWYVSYVSYVCRHSFIYNKVFVRTSEL